MRYDSPWTSHDLVKLRRQSDFKLDTYSVNVELLDFDCWVRLFLLCFFVLVLVFSGIYINLVTCVHLHACVTDLMIVHMYVQQIGGHI